MSLIVAIEPDARQAAQLKALVRHRVGADLVHAATTEQALTELAKIGDRVPDLVLVPSLLSPQEDAALAGALRIIATVANVRMLTIPVLAEPEQPSGKGLFSRWRSKTVKRPGACDPGVFADQISEYLREVADERRARLADAIPEPVAVAADALATESLAIPEDAVVDTLQTIDTSETVDTSEMIDTSDIVDTPAISITRTSLFVREEPVPAPSSDEAPSIFYDEAPSIFYDEAPSNVSEETPRLAAEPISIFYDETPEIFVDAEPAAIVDTPTTVVDEPLILAAAPEPESPSFELEPPSEQTVIAAAPDFALVAQYQSDIEAAVPLDFEPDEPARPAQPELDFISEPFELAAPAYDAPLDVVPELELSAQSQSELEAAVELPFEFDEPARIAQPQLNLVSEAEAREEAAREEAAREEAAREAAAREAAAREQAAREEAAREEAARQAAAREAAAREAAAREAVAREQAAREAAAREAAAREQAAREKAAREDAAREEAARQAAAREAAAREAAAHEAAAREAAAREAAAREEAALTEAALDEATVEALIAPLLRDLEATQGAPDEPGRDPLSQQVLEPFLAGVREPLPQPTPELVAAEADPDPLFFVEEIQSPPRRDESAWMELIASLRQDIERLKQDKGETPVATAAPARQRATSRPARKARPTKDQWGLFDPDQCGFGALLAKLDEINAREEVGA